MNTEYRQIVVSGLPVQIVRKGIKNLHLGVYPPHGRVRVAAPMTVTDEAVRLAVVGKLGWIKRQRARFAAQPRQSEREMVRGESHYFLGARYRLRLIRSSGAASIMLRNKTSMELHVRPDATVEQRVEVLHQWYRQQLRDLIPPLLKKWEKALGVRAAEWGIKKMKTKWGSCNSAARRIWLNLELAKKPAQCLEYVIAHELAHLIERHHNERFIAILDKHLPHWRVSRGELNASPLSNEAWSN
jgi:predicted metal-dependent hydrolase